MFLKISQDAQKNTKELQKYIPVNADFAFATIEKFILQAEEYWLPQFFSQTEIKNLQETFDSEMHKINEMMIFDLINKIVIHYAFYLALPYLNAQISSSGVKKRTLKEKVIETNYSEEEIENLRNLELETTYNAIDSLLNHFIIYQTNFVFWKNNFENDLFLPSEKDFSKIISLAGSPFTYSKLINLIREQEQTLIVDILGEDLFLEIKSQFLAKNMYLKYNSILHSIKYILAYATIAEALQILPLDVIGLGFKIMPSANLRSKNPKEIDNIIVKHRGNVEHYKSRLEQFLKQEQDFLPLYKKSVVKTRGFYDANSSIISL